MQADLPSDDGAPRRLRDRVMLLVRAVLPSQTAWRGATLGLIIAGLGVWGWGILDLVSPASVTGPAVLASAGIIVALLGAGLVVLILAGFARVPWHFRWAAIGGFALAFLAVEGTAPLGVWTALAVVVVALLTAAVVGGTAAILLSGKWRQGGRFRRVKAAICGAAGLAVLVAAAVWLIYPGRAREELPKITSGERLQAAPSSLSDPAAPGEFSVASLTYGAGSDLHRPEFAGNVTLRTEPVDGSEVLEGWDGFTGWARTRYFGFDDEKLPLNGRVWYPQADGPFPLVLVVHGNHMASKFSDPGYQYLGEHLASRGYIFVSVDENFFNSMESDLWWGLERANNARGWLLLEHLRLWHAWNRDSGSPFFEKVDTERIALIGHSRGGEAVAHAAAFNRLPFNPDNAKAEFDYGYNIRSLVAIAPADGQYKPTGLRTRLQDVNYFTIQGSHDSDVSSFMGLYQYDRVTFTGQGDWFKSAVYVYGANHGQFNTTWGTYDVGAGLTERMLNTNSLLPSTEQRQIALVYITAFLECTLRDKREYRPLFESARYGANWLPDTAYLTEYADSSMRTVCDFEEDIDLTTTTVAGGSIASKNLSLWREKRDDLRSGVSEDRAAWLGWDLNKHLGDTTYTIRWPADSFELSEDTVLSFTLADAASDPTPHDEPDAEQDSEPTQDDKREPLDLTIEAIDAEGHSARLPLSHDAELRAQIETPFYKSRWLHTKGLSEPIPQTFRLPLADFHAANGKFDAATISAVRFVFDRTKSGVVILDNVALSASPTKAEATSAQ